MTKSAAVLLPLLLAISSPMAYADVDGGQLQKNSVQHIHATIQSAVACRDAHDLEGAQRLFAQAADEYFTLYQSATGDQNSADDRNTADESECRKDLWSHLEFLPPDSFQPTFARLFKISEKKTSDQPTHSIDSVLRRISSQIGLFRNSAIANGQSGGKTEPFDYVQFWKTAIDIRASVRGADSPNLLPLLENYATACEGKDDFVDAESAYLRLARVAEKASVEERATIQINLVKLYLRSRMDDKAEAAYHDAFRIAKEHMSRKLAAQFVSLTHTFGNRKPSPALVNEIMTDLLRAGAGDTVQRESELQK